MTERPVVIQARPGLPLEAAREIIYKAVKDLSLQAQERNIQSGLKFDLCDGREVSPLVVYFKQDQATKVVFERPHLALSERLRLVLQPHFLAPEGTTTQALLNKFARYAVISPELGHLIRQKLETIGAVRENEVNGDAYDVSLTRSGASVRVRRFSNGTLLVQGAGTSTWDEACTAIEGLVSPGIVEVATRFVSASQEETDRVAGLLTPKLQEDAQCELRGRLGPAFDFMTEWDQKYLLSSLVLLRSGLEVPEYSCMVMPASKAFEGYAREVFLQLGVIKKEETQKKAWTVLQVFKKDQAGKYENPDLQKYVSQGKYRGAYLDKLRNDLDFYRNFMMHSDDASITKVTTLDAAKEIVERVVKSLQESFKFLVRGIE